MPQNAPKITSRRKRERSFFDTQVCSKIVRGLWSDTLEWIEFGYVHELYSEESECVPAVRRSKVVTETGLIVRQYDRLSQQQLSVLFYMCGFDMLSDVTGTELKLAAMMFTDFALTSLIISMISYTCRSCQFPVYMHTSATEAARRRDWRARSRSSRVAATSVRVVVDGKTLSWNELNLENGAKPMYVDHCLEEIVQVRGFYVFL